MAKVTLMEPYGSIRGMICKHFGVVNQVRYHGKDQVLYRRHNNPTVASSKQTTRRNEFSAIIQAVNTALAAGSSTLTAYQTAYKSNPKGCKTLRGYVFKEERDKMVAAGTVTK